MDPNINLDGKGDEEEGEAKERNTNERVMESCATAIGSLADIAYAVQRLAQFTKNPRLKHWTAVKQIFRYLKGTRTHTLTYGRSESTELKIFCDADWASNADRKSTSRYAVLFAGATVTWSATKQSTVALSTANVEYIAATHAAKQVPRDRAFCEEIGVPQPAMLTIYCDNQAAIVIAHHPKFHVRMKHIDIAYHSLHDFVENGTLDIVYVPSHENLVGLFT